MTRPRPNCSHAPLRGHATAPAAAAPACTMSGMSGVLLGVMTLSPESAITIGVSLLGVISLAVFHSLALRRAKRGPAPRAGWEFTRSMRRVVTASGLRDEPGPYVLQNTGDADALKVRLDWEVAPDRYDGPIKWKRFSAHATFRLPMVVSRRSPPPVIRLRWRDAQGRGHVWVSEPQHC